MKKETLGDRRYDKGRKALYAKRGLFGNSGVAVIDC